MENIHYLRQDPFANINPRIGVTGYPYLITLYYLILCSLLDKYSKITTAVGASVMGVLTIILGVIICCSIKLKLNILPEFEGDDPEVPTQFQ